MAAVDYFLKLDGVNGDSADRDHKQEIEISSFSWGMSNSGTASHGGGGGAGKVSVQDFHFVTHTGVQSPSLLVATGTGQHFKKAVLTVRKAGEKQAVEFLKIRLTDVLVSSYQVGGTHDGGDGVPMDQFSLNFSKIEMEVSQQSVDGTTGKVVGGWDVAANKKV